MNISPEGDDRSVIRGIILGYSRLLGYPRCFDHTFVAEVGGRASEETEEGAIVSAGVSLGQQVGHQSVPVLGLKGDIGGGDGEHSQLRLVAGYSVAF
ncbi:MAG: hypothetical protein RMX65_000650 [Nostoc sp. DedQUE01]|nr:hypothetical protein [Nostoc sp. DedQUE01]